MKLAILLIIGTSLCLAEDTEDIKYDKLANNITELWNLVRKLSSCKPQVHIHVGDGRTKTKVNQSLGNVENEAHVYLHQHKEDRHSHGPRTYHPYRHHKSGYRLVHQSHDEHNSSQNYPHFYHGDHFHSHEGHDVHEDSRHLSHEHHDSNPSSEFFDPDDNYHSKEHNSWEHSGRSMHSVEHRHGPSSEHSRNNPNYLHRHHGFHRRRHSRYGPHHSGRHGRGHGGSSYKRKRGFPGRPCKHEQSQKRYRATVSPTRNANSSEGLYEYAICYMTPNRMPPRGRRHNVRGPIYIRQKSNSTEVEMKLTLRGFSKMTGGHHNHNHVHGFHLHELGDLSQGCQSLGGHYNPRNVNHAGPNDTVRHPGDFGNISCDSEGAVVQTVKHPAADLDDIIGRSLVIHALADDLGKVNNTGSRASGNAGPRVACCVVGRSNGNHWNA